MLNTTQKPIVFLDIENSPVMDFDTHPEDKPKANKPPAVLPPIPDDAPEIPEFMVGNLLYRADHLDDEKYEMARDYARKDSPAEANLISSKIKGTTKHRPILDIDFPAALIPSSTEGRFHLYLDKELTEDQMEKLVLVLKEVGILAEGNVNQWFGPTKSLLLRLPWIKKIVGEDTPKE